METFSALLAICAGNSPVPWRGALMFSLTCVWINDWVDNGEAGDLRRYGAHYDVTVMHSSSQISHYVIVQLCAINVMYKINENKSGI